MKCAFCLHLWLPQIFAHITIANFSTSFYSLSLQMALFAPTEHLCNLRRVECATPQMLHFYQINGDKSFIFTFGIRFDGLVYFVDFFSNAH